uniref:Uncharacterized protein LOC100181757 n=1 Tax=Phallusia mammillata TaxID=59560 RepID=A0A6F9DI69_9ASCI|nr:uncharacterized protein LOC100181757 [Phallusia mammillata]
MNNTSKTMEVPIQFQFIAPSTVLMLMVIGTGLVDQVYTDVDLSKRISIEDGALWMCFLFFVTVACIWRSYQARQLANGGKITGMDVEFVAVLNAFTFAQLATAFGEFRLSIEPEKNSVVIRRLNAVGDWSLLLFLGWTVIWGRHLRRGWDFQHNLVIYAASLLGYVPIVIHRTSFYFVLGVAITLSCIALYETYKIHYYRNNVKKLFYSLLPLTICFYIFRLLAYIFAGYGWYLTYAHITLFALMSSLTNRLYVQILKEVNEHKH